MSDNEDREAKAVEAAENLKRLNEEFIRDTPGVHPIGKAAPDGQYGHAFHDRVAAYINDPNTNQKLMGAFQEGFQGQQREKALTYLRAAGIINATTATSRINEFLAAWGIAPLPGQESDDVTEALRIAEHESGGPTDIGEATVVTGPAVTKSGKVLTDEDFEALADEAERGYDVSHLKPRVTPSQDDEIIDAEIIEDDE